MKLKKRIKEVVAIGCQFRIREEDDGLVIEFEPLPARSRGKFPGRCAIKTDPWGNVIGCTNLGCSGRCKVTEGATGYSCECVKPPSVPPSPPTTPTPSPHRRRRSRTATTSKSKRGRS